MGSSLNVMQSMARKDARKYKDLIPSLVSILKQICEGRLPSDYDYHRVPAPWYQLQLVRILGVLGRADPVASSGMYEVLGDAMRKADNGINAGYAISYECIRAAVSIYPHPPLLDAAAQAISRVRCFWNVVDIRFRVLFRFVAALVTLGLLVLLLRCLWLG